MEWWIWLARWFLFVSPIQDYFLYIIKKHGTLTVIPPIHVHINRTNKRLLFKINNEYKLE